MNWLHSRSYGLCAALIVCVLTWSAQAATFDHAASASGSLTLDAEPGDRIPVTIINTCTSYFDYPRVSLPATTSLAPTSVSDRSVLAAGQCAETLSTAQKDAIWLRALEQHGICVMDTKEIADLVHQREFVGYAIDLTKKPGSPEDLRGVSPAQAQMLRADFESRFAQSNATGNCVTEAEGVADAALDHAQLQRLEPQPRPMRNGTVVVNIDRSPWAIAMSGGFSFSRLVDQQFALINDPASVEDPPTQIVIRDQDAEDSERLGFVGFLHLHRDSWRRWAPTFGLGSGAGNELNMFLGVSVAARDVAYFTAGWNFGPVRRLPNGQQLDAPPIDANVLNNLPTRTDRKFFIAVSFKMLSPSESFFTQRIATKSSGPAE